MAAVLVVCALLCRQEWQALLLITVAMMYQSQGNYIYCMALIPLAYFLAQEKVMTRQNILPFAVLMAFNLPLPIFEERNSYIRNTIVQLAILTAIIWGVVQAVNCVLAALKTKKPEQSKLDKKLHAARWLLSALHWGHWQFPLPFSMACGCCIMRRLLPCSWGWHL